MSIKSKRLALTKRIHTAGHRCFAMLICLGAAGCDITDTIEGCGSESAALAAEGLSPSDNAVFDLSSESLPLPSGTRFRIRDGLLQLFAAPGVYCDSGEWGVVQDGFLQLQVHESTAPIDPFQNFPQTHRGYMREQIELGLGPFSYSFEHNALTWHVDAYMTGNHNPRTIFMYLRTEIPIVQSTQVAIHYFPGRSGASLAVLTASIEKMARQK